MQSPGFMQRRRPPIRRGLLQVGQLPRLSKGGMVGTRRQPANTPPALATRKKFVSFYPADIAKAANKSSAVGFERENAESAKIRIGGRVPV